MNCADSCQLYFLILAGWVNRQQQEVTNHLRIENQIVKEQLGKIGIHMTGNSFGSAMGGLDGWPAYGFGTLESLCGNVDVELQVGGTFCRVLQWRVLAGV